MKATIVALVLIVSLPYFEVARGQNRGRLMLPNPKLLRCGSSECFQLWPDAVEPKTIFPKQMIVDMDQGCIYGMTALYDKAVPVDQIKSAIDELYAQWSVKEVGNSIHVWRVEPQKFSIQLAVASKNDPKRNVAEAGTSEAIFTAFGGRAACSTP